MFCPIPPLASEWPAWLDCSHSCDGGIRTRRRHCTKGSFPAKTEDDVCPTTGGVAHEVAKEACSSQRRDCSWGRWASCGACSGSCHLSGVIAQGRRQRKRTVQVHEQYGGTPCEGSTSEADSCGSPICREGVYLKYCLRTQKDNILQIILELYLSGDQIAWGIWPS